MTEPSTFGETLRAIRKHQGWTLKEAAARSDGAISATGLLRIEKDVRDPMLTTLEAVAKANNVEIRITPDGVYVEQYEE